MTTPPGDQVVILDLVQAHDELDLEGLAALLAPQGWSAARVTETVRKAVRESRLFEDCRLHLHAV